MQSGRIPSKGTTSSIHHQQTAVKITNDSSRNHIRRFCWKKKYFGEKSLLMRTAFTPSLMSSLRTIRNPTRNSRRRASFNDFPLFLLINSKVALTLIGQFFCIFSKACLANGWCASRLKLLRISSTLFAVKHRSMRSLCSASVDFPGYSVKEERSSSMRCGLLKS